jgi:osmotically-inducible protein OsmY
MRGWQRTDERIREDVCGYLSAHPGIDTTDMEVTVSDGEVTLEGTVDDRFEKRMAEDLAEAVAGVRDVHNRLRIDTPRRDAAS